MAHICFLAVTRVGGVQVVFLEEYPPPLAVTGLSLASYLLFYTAYSKMNTCRAENLTTTPQWSHVEAVKNLVRQRRHWLGSASARMRARKPPS